MSQPPFDDQREAIHHHREVFDRDLYVAEATPTPRVAPTLIGRPVTLYGPVNGQPSDWGHCVTSVEHGAPMAGQIVWHSMRQPDMVTVAGFDHVGQPFVFSGVLLARRDSPQLSMASPHSMMAVLA